VNSGMIEVIAGRQPGNKSIEVIQSLVEFMQGTIGVESVPGEGSLFWCEVDFSIGTEADGETATSHPIAGRRGLVVDNHPLARSILQSQLETLGVRVDAVGMDDFLSKPISEAILRHTLKRWFPGADLGDGKSTGSAIADGDAGAAFRQMQAAGPELMTRLVDLFLDNTADSLEAVRVG